uniref:Uncharacterized protein LOC113795830 n=1 Tax=Dermatophagoides pteronyssinus TaxID=6956 RepID=A0A6P6Y971_DERPT|nr:uncharacterized protein LOC113795830 [Dermatophagoides pteronyssinus]
MKKTLLKYRHFIYNIVKHIVEQHNTRQYRQRHLLDVLLFLYGLIRLLFPILMYLDSEQYPFYQYDYVSGYFWKYRKILNKFFLILIILFLLTGLVGLKIFYFTHVDTLSFQVSYDCIVYNTDQYGKKLEHVDRKLFLKQNKMRLFPYANLKSRTYTLLLLFVMEISNFLGHIFIGK